MQYLEMPTLNEFATMLVSFFSLWVALKAYSQSIPKLQLNMYLAKIHNLAENKTADQDYLFISVVNTSSRPITITNLGGNYESKTMMKIKAWFGVKQKRGFIWQDVAPLIFDRQGSFRVVRDGDYVSHQIPLRSNKGENSGKPDDFSKVKRIWVSDAAGREFCLPRPALKNLKKSLAERSQKQTKDK